MYGSGTRSFSDRHRSLEIYATESGLMTVGGSCGFFLHHFPTSFIGNPGSSFIPDGSPITYAEDDGEGRESSDNLPGC